MAISEACKYEIEESVDKACEEQSISKTEAFEALEKFYNSIGVPIKFSTIKRKYYRAKEEKVTNVTPNKTEEISTTSANLNNLEKPIEHDHGGRREGAGRKPTPRPTLSEKEKIIDAEFQDGFNLLFRAIKNAKHSKWTLTSKEAALKHIEILYNVITIT